MTRYIAAVESAEIISKELDIPLGDLVDIFAEIPTADVAEVVKCKDCTNYRCYGNTSLLVDGKNVKAGWCHRRARYDEEYRMLPDDFCSYGERTRLT